MAPASGEATFGKAGSDETRDPNGLAGAGRSLLPTVAAAAADPRLRRLLSPQTADFTSSS